MKIAIFNLTCYIIGFVWSVFFGVRDLEFISFLGVAFLIVIQLIHTRRHSEFTFIQDLLLIPFCTIFGIMLEMVLIKAGAIHYTDQIAIFPPIWMIVLYPLFSLLINHSLMPATNSQFVTFIVGFFGVPISYMIGHYANGLIFPHSVLYTWVVIGTCWGIFLCFLKYFANIIKQAAQTTFDEMDKTTNLKFFYDGECPICTREVCQLQKNDPKKSMKFINIASHDFVEEKGNLDYETAMKAMHAQDEKGNLFVGFDAFAKAYARCDLPLLATVLNLPFLRPVLDPMYRLFAKHRMFITGRKK